MHQEAKNVQLTEEQIRNLSHALKRLFSLPIKRSTLREFHGILMRLSMGNETFFKELFESFLLGSGTFPEAELNEVVKEYMPLVRLAREVHDRGEYLSFITSDVLSYKDKAVLSNLFRTVDGTESHFITDIPTTLQLIQHFSARLHEIAKNETGNEQVKEYKNAIDQIKNLINELQAEIS